jgi:outer membrane receptor for ferrienterochelin and colicins
MLWACNGVGLALAAGVLGASPLAFAADTVVPAVPPKTDLADLSLEELATVKVATVYGASKHEQSITEAPSAVSIVTADDIKKSGYRTLTDILNSVGGFYTTSDRAYSYVGVRGFNRPGDYGGRLLICIDGHRMNDAIFDSAANGTEFILDTDLIDRVEVIRGPGSSLYGNNAIFGVINVITRRGRDFGGVEASGAYGSYDTWTGRLSYGNRFTNGIELALSGSYLDSEGHDSLYYPEFSHLHNGRADNSDGSWAANGFGSISYRDFSLEGGFVQRNKTLPTAAYGAVFNDPRNEILDQRAFADFKFQHEFEHELNLSTRLYYDSYLYKGTIPQPEHAYDDPAYPGRITINRDHADAQSLGLEAQLTKILWEKHRLTGGVDYRHDFNLDQLNYDEGSGATYVNDNSTADTVGVYAQDEFSMLPNLLLNIGLRYDYFSSFGDTFNPRVALIYSPWTNSTFKAIYGQAYRAPNAYELHYEAPGYSANPNLQPETSRSYELDYEQSLGSHFRLTSSLFYYQVDDLITFQENAAGEDTFGNLAGATSQGAEVELDAHWAKGWRACLSYTYADARDSDTDEWLSNSPRNVAKFNFTAPLWREKVFANLELLGITDRRTVQGHTVQGYLIANLTLYSRDIVKGLEFSASVYNLFDQKYSDPVSGDFLQDAIEQDGRSFRIKLTYRF